MVLAEAKVGLTYKNHPKSKVMETVLSYIN